MSESILRRVSRYALGVPIVLLLTPFLVVGIVVGSVFTVIRYGFEIARQWLP